MKWSVVIVCALVFASGTFSDAAPVTFKEISMLVRNGEREQFVFGEVEKRKLLQPLSKQEEAALAGMGASAALLNALRSQTLLAPPEMVAAYKARLHTPAPAAQPPLVEDAARAMLVAPPQPSPAVANVTAAISYAKNAAPIALMANDAYSLDQLDDAKAKAQAGKKPLGFIMVWGEFFGKRADPRSTGSISALAHFYRAFESTLVLVFVRHETELNSVPDAVKKGFKGPDEGGFAPNMAVVDATASEFIVEIPMGGGSADGKKRDEIFTAGAAKIEKWLAAHPRAVGPLDTGEAPLPVR